MLKSVKTMKPSFVAVATRMKDIAPETPSRWEYIEGLKQKVIREAMQIQTLLETTTAKSLKGKLNRLQQSAFLADIPDDQYRELINISAAASADRASSSPPVCFSLLSCASAFLPSGVLLFVGNSKGCLLRGLTGLKS